MPRHFRSRQSKNAMIAIFTIFRQSHIIADDVIDDGRLFAALHA